MIDERYVVPPEVVVFPVERLAAAIQAQLGTKAGEFAVTNPAGRGTTTVLSAETAELMRCFSEPVSVARAVVGYSAGRQADPHLVLDEAYPVLRQLMAAGFLVAADCETGVPDELPVQVDEFDVVKLVHRLPDVMVLRARTPAGEEVALKVLRPAGNGAGTAVGSAELRREAALLREAAGCRVPRLVRDGSDHDVPYLAMSWVDGVHLLDRAARGRRPWDAGWRASVLTLAHTLLAAYVELHERGILHADVHPKNVLVGAGGTVTLIDFGLAVVPADPQLATGRRAGVVPYLEPEWAVARLRGTVPPPATVAGEQHALGALLYQVFTGQHYVPTITGHGEMLDRIAHGRPLTFGEHGVPPWPAVEKVLSRMLAKRPADRYPSIAAAAAALPTTPPRTGPGPAVLLRTTLRRLTRDGGVIDTGLPTAPRLSVNYGAAGIAYVLYRLAQQRTDPELLARARQWLGWAHRQRDDPLAYQAPELDLRTSRVGRVSIYHSPAGTACVQALVANAAGDVPRASRAVADFVAISQLPCTNLDLTLGRTSTLVGATLLYEALHTTSIAEQRGLVGMGDTVLAGVLRGLPEVVADTEAMPYRGVAHGWAGILYAALRWCEATGAAVPELVVDRLAELATRGSSRHDIPMAGWCHGPAGTVHLWAAAYRVLGEAEHLDRALRAAEAAWRVQRSVPTLCCGLAGQGYAMLAAYALTGQARWVRRAKRLAGLASAGVGGTGCHPNSLWKGEVGVALLVADLEDPGTACLPLFGAEGWPAPPRTLRPLEIRLPTPRPEKLAGRPVRPTAATRASRN